MAGRFISTEEMMRTRFWGSAAEAIDGETRANAANNTNNSALPSAGVILTLAKCTRGEALGLGTKTNGVKPIKRDAGGVEIRLINFVALR
jgi:hypothetical protein